jgi:hypothetical protein
MQYFSTDFPLSIGTSAQDILEECLYWINDSPHTKFVATELLEGIRLEDFNKRTQGEEINFELADDENFKIHSFIYTKSNKTNAWITSITFLTVPATGEAWVNVKAYCNAYIASAKVPDIKKPLIILRLIDRYGGGLDGDLIVNHEFAQLEDDQAGLDQAARLINGACGNRLPILYITKYHSGNCSVIPDRIARAVSGLAHVAVEPNRIFSNKLRPLVNSQNVYGGGVGIYWPSDGGVSIYRKASSQSMKDFESEILEDLSTLTAQRMPLRKCSIEALRETKNRRLIQRLKSEDSSDLSAYIEAFDQELEAKDEEINLLQREVARLEAASRSFRAKNPVTGGIIFDIGEEEDFFEDEIRWIMLDAMVDHCSRVPDDSRRLHILQAVVSQKPERNFATEIASSIRETLRGYREMTPKIRSTLIQLGFAISEEGKHFKLVYNEDSRYTFTLPKSGSDGRGGLNSGSDIIRLFL